jgi:hypothetical protein
MGGGASAHGARELIISRNMRIFRAVDIYLIMSLGVLKISHQAYTHKFRAFFLVGILGRDLRDSTIHEVGMRREPSTAIITGSRLQLSTAHPR